MYKTAFVYLGISGFCGLFSAVYEAFSHGVYSPWMVFLFAWPLIGGALPYALIARFAGHLDLPWARLAHHGAVACATVGACVAGVLQIYGTSSAWVSLYWIAASVLAIPAAMVGAEHLLKRGHTVSVRAVLLGPKRD